MRMKTIFFLFLGFNSFKIAACEEVADVYYFEFNVQRITGLHEESMYDYFIGKAICESDWVLLEKEAENKYNKYDVRALVRFSDDKLYYIDRYGYFSGNGKHGVIDKKKFNELVLAFRRKL